jgi:hypothetical protein
MPETKEGDHTGTFVSLSTPLTRSSRVPLPSRKASRRLVPRAKSANRAESYNRRLGGKLLVIFFGYIRVCWLYSEYKGIFFQNVMPGRAGGSRGSAPSMPYLNEARPTTISSEGLSGRRGAPTGAKVRVVTLVIFQDIFSCFCWSNSVLYRSSP